MDSSSPSTCLSLSSSDLFASPSNSSLASWPSSPTSSKRSAAAAAAAAARFSSSPSKRRQGAAAGQLDHHPDIDCTLSLGNAATRKSEDAPSRLSRAGSPVEDRGGGHGGGQQFHWLRAQQPNLQCDLAAEAATRNLASLRRLQQVDAAQPSSYQSILAAQNSHFPPYIPCTSATKLGGLLDFSATTHHCSSSSSTLSGFLDMNAKFSSADSCGTRSRFRGGDGQHNDPRNVPRICAHCGTSSTPLWRNGPLGPKSLCNACGIRFKKVGRRSPTTAAAATAPVSSWSMQVPSAAAAFHQDTFGIRSSSSEGIPPPMASPLVVQRDKRNCIPFAREWSESTSSSNYAVGSSCITWQDSSSSLPSSFDSGPNMRRVVSSSSSRLSSPPAAAVLEAEVIRSSDDRRRVEQGSFLKIAL